MTDRTGLPWRRIRDFRVVGPPADRRDKTPFGIGHDGARPPAVRPKDNRP